MFDWLKIRPEDHATNFGARLGRLVGRYRGKAPAADLAAAMEAEITALHGPSRHLQLERALHALTMAAWRYRKALPFVGSGESSVLHALEDAIDEARALLDLSDPAEEPDVRQAFRIVPEGSRLSLGRDEHGRPRFHPLDGGDDGSA